jgi:hypothetical protein
MLTVFLTVFVEMHASPKPKSRQIGCIALTVFSVGFVLKNALEGVINSLFGTLFTTEWTTFGGPPA